MPQLGRFEATVIDPQGNSVSGASVTIYREGATVNGNQSGTNPFNVVVRHIGKIGTNDTVIINANESITYMASATSSATVQLSNIAPSLSLSNGDRLTPANNKPTLYGDDQGGATISNPLITNSNGRASCWMEFGAYDVVVSGGGAVAQSFVSQVTPTEAPNRSVYVESYGLTQAGVQAALDEMENAGGGTVYIPANANIFVSSSSIKIGNRVALIGTGDHMSLPTFVPIDNLSAVVENKTQDGTQQYAYVKGIRIDGNKGSFTVSAGLKFRGVYLGSRIEDVLITNCSGNGLVLQGGTGTTGMGPYPIINVTVTTCNDHNVLVSGAGDGLYFYQLSSESVAAGKALVKVTNNEATASFGHGFFGLHFEGTSACDGLWLDGVSNINVDTITFDGSGASNLVKITGSVTGSDGAFAAGGHVIKNANANLTTIIDDQVASVTVGNAQSRFVQFYLCPVHVQSGGNDLSHSQVIGLQPQKQGIDLVSGTSIDPVDGNFFIITGNNSIDNMTNGFRYKGRVVIFHTTGTPTFVHNSGGTGNIRCTGSANLVMAANRRVTFYSDGTNWWQLTATVSA